MALSGLLLLTDARMPAGGHAHSGGIEAAVNARTVRDVADLAAFLRGRLHTTGRVAAAAAAAACARAADPATALDSAGWGELDAEVSARTPSPAQREASRAQARTLLRAARVCWPAAVLDLLARARPGTHHSVALGAAAACAGCPPAEAALAGAYLSVTGPATAVVRLLGLDPLAVHAVLARLGADLDAVAAAAAAAADGPLPELPSVSAPRLDLLAQDHARSELTLFAS
jgi:urease accessory protein